MAELVLRPESFVYKLPDHITYEQGAMIEPISVAMHAADRSGITPGKSAAIIGCGPIGGCLLLVLKAYGVNRVWMTDVVPGRLDFMKSIGADGAFQVQNLSQKEMETVIPEQVDVVFDTTCNENAINAGFHWLKKGGNLVLVGVPTGQKSLDVKTAFSKELSILTTFRYANTYQPAIGLIASGKLKPELLVSKVFPLREAEQAMKTAIEQKNEVMKVLIQN